MFNKTSDLINWIESLKRLSPKVSLDRFKDICKVYGSPEEKAKYIHVGGTNGKGSTVSYIRNILNLAGYKIATYVSPYVLEFNERISYDGKFISDEDLLDIGNYIISKYDILDRLELSQPSFFEFVTLVAFIYFSRIKDLDFVVLEVGLGGLLDSTNIIIPLLSVITNVSFDHMNVLGNTIEEIALNKLGIVKEGIPLIMYKNNQIDSLSISVTNKKNSQLVHLDKTDIKNIKLSLEDTKFDYLDYKNISLSLLGAHQTENAVLAITVIEELRNRYKYIISDESIYTGLKILNWPGRLQLVSTKPIVLLDGAHNIDGITRLKEFLEAIKEKRFLKIIFAVSADKAKSEMIELLDEIADEIVFTSFSYKRSDEASNLINLSQNSHRRLEEDLDKLVEEALKDNDDITVFCGSLYFVSELLKKF